jgi:hypothetical protein
LQERTYNNKTITMTKKQQIQLFSTDDSSLRFHEESGCHFAAKWPHIPVHIQEAIAFSQVLPLVFRKNAANELELSILLNRKGKPVITDNNQWPIKRVPALLNLYPFSWVTQGEEKKLAYYADAPHFVGDGQKLITSKKKPTKKLRQYLDALQQTQAAFSATSKILEELNKQDILTESGSYWILSKQPEQTVIDELSPALKKLLQSHVNSLQHLAIQAQKAEKPAEKKTSKKADKKATTEKPAKAKKPKKKDGVQGIIDQVCQSLSVSSDEVKGRKRGEILTQARVQLAEKSKEAGHFDQMAEWLQRSPATLNSWLR